MHLSSYVYAICIIYISKKYVFEIIDGLMFNDGLVQIRNFNPKVEKHFGELTSLI